jgi:hypothetical protein
VSITVTPASPSIAIGGSQLQLSATGLYSNQGTQDLTASAVWSSSSLAVAGVTAGLVTSASSGCGGWTTIAATVGAISGYTPVFVSVPGGFACGATMTVARDPHTATLLNDGRVLITGGISTGGIATNTAEIYSPSSRASVPTGVMSAPRANHTATILDNGKVLIVGGVNSAGAPLTTAEIFDPALGSFTPTGSMATARSNHTATVLSGGTVLIAGGSNGGSLSSAELYNPVTETFTAAAGTMHTPRSSHAATLLMDGSGYVLITGGVDNTGQPSDTSELYVPGYGFSVVLDSTGTRVVMNDYRAFHTSTLLPNGTVLLDGGANGIGTSSIAEIYDPAAQTMTVTASSPITPRYGQTATLLTNGQVLIAGGAAYNPATGTDVAQATAEIYDPGSQAFSGTTNPQGQPTTLNTARDQQTATLLNTGSVLLAGGVDSTGAPTASIELFTPSALTPPGLTGGITVSPSGVQIPIGTTVQFTASATVNGVVQTLNNVSWGSSNLTALTITNDVANSGVGYPLAPQAVTVTACLGAALCGQTNVTVIPAAIVSIVLAPAGAVISDPPGTPVAFTATATYTDGSSQVITPAWTSSDITVATIASTGLASPVNPPKLSSTTITASAPGANGTTITGSAILTVTNSAQAASEIAAYYEATGTLLSCPACVGYPNGKVLIVGGYDASFALLSQGELYDPASGTFSPTGSLANPRKGHSATLLNDGTVLIVGGDTPGGPAVAVAELYNPLTGTFSQTGSLVTPRANHTATLIQCSCPANGQVLIAGGVDNDYNYNALSSSELYNPATGAFSATAAMSVPHFSHTASLLDTGSGKVLVAGGYSAPYVASTGTYQISTDKAEIYDPNLGTFTLTSGSLHSFPGPGNSLGRVGHTATSIGNGRILIAGGEGVSYQGLSTPTLEEIFDPTLNGGLGGFTPTARLTYPREYHTATLLTDGKVLFAGGGLVCTGCNLTPPDELFDPNGNSGVGSFSVGGTLITPRNSPIAVRLANGTVLIVGGQNVITGAVLTSSEILPGQ